MLVSSRPNLVEASGAPTPRNRGYSRPPDGRWEEGSLLSSFPDTFQALTGHTENITLLDSSCVLLAEGPTCPVQIFRYGEHTWAAQFHAEMDPASMQIRMNFYMDYGYFHKEDYDAIVATLPTVDTTYSNGLLASFVRYCQ